MPPIQFLPTAIPEVRQLPLPRFADARGWFAETWNPATFRAALEPETAEGRYESLCRTISRFLPAHVLRGMHYQVEQPQGKLIQGIAGADF